MLKYQSRTDDLLRAVTDFTKVSSIKFIQINTLMLAIHAPRRIGIK